MYCDWLMEAKQGQKIKDIFPNLSVMIYGGVNFEPYKSKLFETIGKKIDAVETFPASEGFFAYQNDYREEGMLLNTNSGIFFEFIPIDEVFNDKPTRLKLDEVEVDKNYALIINSNAGLWAYNLGDTIKFISLDPYKIIVTGRIKHFISAFGEHVIAEEVEHTLMKTAQKHQIKIIEFSVAPMIQTHDELPYHEWFIEFEQLPDNLNQFAKEVDNLLRQKNAYYDDLISGGILQTLKIVPMQPKSFQNYMKSIGKLG